MAIEWGVVAVAIPETRRRRGPLGARRSTLRAKPGSVEAGDRVVITAGHRRQHPGLDQRDQGRHRLIRRSAPDGEGDTRAARTRPSRGERRQPATTQGAHPAATPRRVPARRRAATGACGSPRRRAVVFLAVAAFLYARPLSNYSETRPTSPRASSAVADAAAAEARARRAARADDRPRRPRARRPGASATSRPGEQLFIVKGIPAWREARTRCRRSTSR